MKNTLIFGLVSLLFCTALFSQTKKIVATYDSTLSGFGVEPGAYFTIDKIKKSIVFYEEGYDENRQEVSVSEFWIKEARKYLVNAVERENHTNLKNAGKKYEIEYTVTALGGEDVNNDLYTIVKFNYLDANKSSALEIKNLPVDTFLYEVNYDSGKLRYKGKQIKDLTRPNEKIMVGEYIEYYENGNDKKRYMCTQGMPIEYMSYFENGKIEITYPPDDDEGKSHGYKTVYYSMVT